MSTLDELVRYCREEDHLGALMLTGEWGCGKTYLIEKELAETLRETHFIVRVSLLGVDSVEAMNSAVRKQWLSVCTPFLGKMKQRREKVKGSSFFSALNAALQSLGSVTGNVASAIVTVDPLEYIPLEPQIEDLHDKGEKKEVVLVFDDMNRSRLDGEAIVGNINDYCENMGFKTIIIANEESLKTAPLLDQAKYKMLKEKTVARTVLYIPNYPEIIQGIIDRNKWPDQAYADFLGENEQTIIDVLSSDPDRQDATLGKNHNVRSLLCALREFYRVYELLAEKQIPGIERYLYSFITYTLVSRNGIVKNGQPCFDVGEEDIERLYPGYSSEALPDSLRRWIETGVWEEDKVLNDVTGGGR